MQVHGTQQPQKEGLSVKEFARRIGLGITRTYSEIKLGNIKILKSGKRTIIPVTEVQAFFKRLELLQSKTEGGR